MPREQRVVGSNPTQGSPFKKKVVLGVVELFACCAADSLVDAHEHNSIILECSTHVI